MLGKTVLITDGGGRGAALVDKYGQSKYVKKIIVVPGNDLMQINTKTQVKIFPDLKTTSISEILQICKKEKVDLADVAQDNAVEVGLTNELEKINITVVGPTREAGQIEWDKAWAREFMERNNLPSPAFKICTSEREGMDFLKKQKDSSWFIKASGLAEGKGALPARNNAEGIEKIKQLKSFGKAAQTYLIEEWLVGEEFSAFALCDGKDFIFVGCAQDHKRVNNFDQGENTGGMGCVSNPLLITDSIKKQINTIFRKTINGLIKEKRDYKGVLYLGGMVVLGKVYIIEFNARWGDPEAQVILPGIKNDLYKVSLAISNGKLNNLKIKTDHLVRVIVTAASKGYPVDYSKAKGKKIFGISEAVGIKGVSLYGAGIKRVGKDYLVNGGRVLYTVGSGKNVIEARMKAYQVMSLISIEENNLHYRTDIGWRDVERMRN
ncbi:phosphoribosylamine--glycine ligase [Candidatus Daviesbacteria bacterium]|nr:phosphoribosylamine--glycine ligase [Candidatus Daviesbacteria bacterium]